MIGQTCIRRVIPVIGFLIFVFTILACEKTTSIREPIVSTMNSQATEKLTPTEQQIKEQSQIEQEGAIITFEPPNINKAYSSINNISSFRYTMVEISNNYLEEFEYSSRIDAEIVLPYDLHEIRLTFDGITREIIGVFEAEGGATRCERENGSPWDCTTPVFAFIGGPFDNKMKMWNSILDGRSIWPDTSFREGYEIVDRGIRRAHLEGDDCVIIYYVEEAQFDSGKTTITAQLCLDPSTYFPMYLYYNEESIVGGEISRTSQRIEHYFDFNEEFSIELPIP